MSVSTLDSLAHIFASEQNLVMNPRFEAGAIGLFAWSQASAAPPEPAYPIVPAPGGGGGTPPPPSPPPALGGILSTLGPLSGVVSDAVLEGQFSLRLAGGDALAVGTFPVAPGQVVTLAADVGLASCPGMPRLRWFDPQARAQGLIAGAGYEGVVTARALVTGIAPAVTTWCAADLVAVGPVNWIIDPSFEYDPLGTYYPSGEDWGYGYNFNSYSGAMTIIDGGVRGAQCLQFAATAAGEGPEIPFTQVFQAGLPYTFALWLRAAAAATVELRLGVPSDNAVSASLALTPNWTLYAVTWTPQALVGGDPNFSAEQVSAAVSSLSSGAVTFQADAAITAQAAQAPPYTDGDQPGMAWNGQPGFSQSQTTQTATFDRVLCSPDPVALPFFDGDCGACVWDGLRYWSTSHRLGTAGELEPMIESAAPIWSSDSLLVTAPGPAT
jgi:hypothetical protein